MLSVQGQAEPLVKNVLTLKGCLPIVGAQVLVNNTEEDLLAKWRTFVQEADPDIITGYNIANFDLPYLLKRADTLAKRSAKLKVGGWVGLASHVFALLCLPLVAAARTHSLTTLTPAVCVGCVYVQVFKELGRLKRILASMKDTTFQSSGESSSSCVLS